MKTLDEWNESGLSLDKYIPEPCEIDEDLAMYIGEVICPNYSSENLTQGGDPISSVGYGQDGEIMTYATISRVNEKYFYLGELPEFKQ